MEETRCIQLSFIVFIGISLEIKGHHLWSNREMITNHHHGCLKQRLRNGSVEKLMLATFLHTSAEPRSWSRADLLKGLEFGRDDWWSSVKRSGHVAISPFATSPLDRRRQLFAVWSPNALADLETDQKSFEKKSQVTETSSVSISLDDIFFITTIKTTMPFVIVLAASLPQILFIFSCWVNFELLWILNTSKYYIYIYHYINYISSCHLSWEGIPWC